MDRDASATRLIPPGGPRPPRWISHWALAAAAALLLSGCAQTGRLQYAGHTVSPVQSDSTAGTPSASGPAPLRPLFGDTLIGLIPGTGDSTIRYLGRLRDGYTVDTLNVFVCGDNRPGYRLNRLAPQFQAIRGGISPNPIKIVWGLVNIPIAIVRGLFPDLALLREIPNLISKSPNWSREHQVARAMMVKSDSLRVRGQVLAAVINTGDLVKDGRYPKHWERFLRITEPLTSRVPYFAVAGNHERTDTEDGVENWRTATGLPVGSDRL
ncbi:MAG TPA: metallophosphoesterase, partial [Candidatus Eisenbacteria bacterium]|nr:metallophosphoesterase [Candidatus Eisenbacteria bacterium]